MRERTQVEAVLRRMTRSTPSTRAARSRATPHSGFGRRRAWALVVVHLAMAAHYAHWRLAGRSLAPLELNEAVYAAVEGVVTAGFLLLVVITLSSAVVGRFFCSWGCHLLALQDLSAWILERMRIKPRPLRSRVLAAVPVLLMLYMFVWPLLFRAARGLDVTLHFRGAGSAWSSFLTDDFTRNLPGWPVALATFAVCGFTAVYLLGSRAFCSYVCPYGAVFALADKVAPGRITSIGDCSKCGACTAVCQSHIRVHQELARFGTVVDSACLRDLDCVAACPDGNVRFAFTKPPLLRRLRGVASLRSHWDLSWGEEALVLSVTALSFLGLRGLFGVFPLLLAVTSAVLLAFATLSSLRVLIGRRVRVHVWTLHDGARTTGAGHAWLAANAAGLMLVLHSCAVRGLELNAERHLSRAELLAATSPAQSAEHARSARAQFERLARYALDPPVALDTQLARAAQLADGPATVAPSLPSDAALRELESTRALAESGRLEEALQRARTLAARHPDWGPAHYQLGVLAATRGELELALQAFESAVIALPDDADAHNNLGFLLMKTGRSTDAQLHLERAVALAPGLAAARFNLGAWLAEHGRSSDARAHLEAARALDAHYREAVDVLLATLP